MAHGLRMRSGVCPHGVPLHLLEVGEGLVAAEGDAGAGELQEQRQQAAVEGQIRQHVARPGLLAIAPDRRAPLRPPAGAQGRRLAWLLHMANWKPMMVAMNGHMWCVPILGDPKTINPTPQHIVYLLAPGKKVYGSLPGSATVSYPN